MDFHENNGVFYSSCAQEMPDLWFMIEGDHWVQIRGQDMLTDISRLNDRTLCMINFLPSVDDFWVFGNTIYKDYYVYHNPEERLMGWAPTTKRLKEPLKKGIRPTAVLELEGRSFAQGSKMFERLFTFVFVASVTVATAMFVFSTSFSGLSFLNKVAYSTHSKK